MRINSLNQSVGHALSETNAQPVRTQSDEVLAATDSGDRATLTSQPSVASSLTEKALQSPEVRQDQVSSLKDAVKNGQYQLDPQQIARAIMDDQS